MMGFHEINLIDPDVLEMSNLNRVVGAYYEDAQQKRYKVDVVKRHLTNINPKAPVLSFTSFRMTRGAKWHGGPAWE